MVVLALVVRPVGGGEDAANIHDAQDVLHGKELPAPNGSEAGRPGAEAKLHTLSFLPWLQFSSSNWPGPAPSDAKSINNNDKLSSFPAPFLGGK